MNTQIEFYRASGAYGFLSNLFKCEIAFEGRQFHCAEEAYQFGKPRDPAVAEWLVSAPKPHLCAAAAYALLIYDVRPDWAAIKDQRMRSVLQAKFRQHIDLRDALLQTGDTELIENSKTDPYWGIGKKGMGKNMLGQMLMELRAALRPSLEAQATADHSH